MLRRIPTFADPDPPDDTAAWRAEMDAAVLETGINAVRAFIARSDGSRSAVAISRCGDVRIVVRLEEDPPERAPMGRAA
jgi:hypothetical protein